MRKLDENKLAKLHTAGELLNNKYGEVGTDSRTAFHEKSTAVIKRGSGVVIGNFVSSKIGKVKST